MTVKLEKALDSVTSRLTVSVKQKVQIGNLYLVRVDSDQNIKYGDNKLDRNVYAFNEQGEEVWQIEAAPVQRSPKPYVNIKIEHGKVIAENWTGIEVLVDIDTGSVEAHTTGQRPW